MTRDEIQESLGSKIITTSPCLTDIAPRVGKCRIVLKHVLKEGETATIIHPEVDIKQSWLDECVKLGIDNNHLQFLTTRSIEKFDKPSDWLILDEYHSYSSNQIELIQYLIEKHNIKNIVGLSGSPNNKTLTNWGMITRLKVKVNYSIEQAILDGITSDYRIIVYKIPLSDEEKKNIDIISKQIKFSYNPYRLKQLRLKRMDLIKKSESKINYTKKLLSDNKDKRVLIFTGLTDVADGLGIPSFHSKTKEKEVRDKFIKGEIPHLAIVNKLRMGITFSNLEFSIINFFDSNSENMTQKINRVTNLEYKGKIGEVVIVCSTEEAELNWLKEALSFFDPKKITYVDV